MMAKLAAGVAVVLAGNTLLAAAYQAAPGPTTGKVGAACSCQCRYKTD